jgi:hypothetical protein
MEKFFSDIINQSSFTKDSNKKDEVFTKYINQLTSYHYKKSKLYKKYLNGLKYDPKKKYELSKIPFLPVRLFKEFDFLSIDKKNIYKILNSSGTSSEKLSKIYLDKLNALNQIKILQKIFNTINGSSRLPMLIIDKQITNLDRNKFNASIAAIKGFSIFANYVTYLLGENSEIDYDKLNNFLNRNKKNNFLIFGFTHNIYLNLIKKLDLKKIKYNSFSNALLLHGGGWKKLEKKKIKRKKFNELLNHKLKIKNIKNYYGLVEQIGSIFFECKCGYFIPSNYSEIIIRDQNFKEVSYGKKGFVQLLSLLPTSYPGHSILTEDIGEMIYDPKCDCYGHGKRFLIHGRIKSAELRGCANI